MVGRCLELGLGVISDLCSRAVTHSYPVDPVYLLTDDLRTASEDRLERIRLNAHTIGAFYEAFLPERSFELAQRIELCLTPKHGSWLNIAENELSCMTRQKCVHARRFSNIEQLREETQACTSTTNDKQRGVDWQFKIDDARTKLKSLYPKNKSG
jgi:hypothetical protein